jgi:Phosphatidylinositol 3- and 4-kinase
MYDNMSDFLSELDKICGTIERSLQKSFRQKIADWAMQPWSAGKDAALAEVTVDMRRSLESAASARPILLANPVESSELLSSVDYDECYILPSAHFPILLTFNLSERRCSDTIVGEDRLYRTKVELVSFKSSAKLDHSAFVIHGAVAGLIAASSESTPAKKSSHTWYSGGILVFETRSSWGAPQTLSLRVSGNIDNFDKRGNFHSEVGFCWLDLSNQWEQSEDAEQAISKRISTDVWPMKLASSEFDDHGDLAEHIIQEIGSMQLELRVTTECVVLDDEPKGEASLTRKRMLLYKHDDDLRQEAFAVQFINTCDGILKSCGLDMKLLTFQCIPVGSRRGFVEWVPGSVPLSEICLPFDAFLPGKSPSDVSDSLSTVAKAGLSKYKSLRRLGGQQNESLRLLSGSNKASPKGSIANNPIQDYLRSVAFDNSAPYLIRRETMDAFVKSCAGYSVIAYILGLGDRHLDNILLHQSGCCFHCDFSFILGRDPKKFLPMRITEDMVYGMGGKESDNYAKFLSLVGASFLSLRCPESVRVLLSTVRLMKASCIPDISQNQTIEESIMGIRDRMRLDLSEGRAIEYIEDLVEASLSNKMWLAVDAIHHIGKNL